MKQQGIESKASMLSAVLSLDSTKAKFEAILGKNSTGFINSVILATKHNPKLLLCEPTSVISSAVVAATLNLPIQVNLGFAFIVPYKTPRGMMAQFQMGWKGYVQLAIRTGEYENINAAEVYKGELTSYDKISGEVKIDSIKKESNEVIGYVAYFKLKNGFSKTLFLTKEQAQQHGQKYSDSYKQEGSAWKDWFDGMALKTAVKQLLSKYGLLSAEMKTAITVDQSVINDADTLDVSYVDKAANELGEISGTGSVSVFNNTKQVPEIKITVSEKQKQVDLETNAKNE